MNCGASPDFQISLAEGVPNVDVVGIQFASCLELLACSGVLGLSYIGIAQPCVGNDIGGTEFCGLLQLRYGLIRIGQSIPRQSCEKVRCNQTRVQCRRLLQDGNRARQFAVEVESYTQVALHLRLLWKETNYFFVFANRRWEIVSPFGFLCRTSMLCNFVSRVLRRRRKEKGHACQEDVLGKHGHGVLELQF